MRDATASARRPHRRWWAALAPLAVLLASGCIVEAAWTPQPVEPAVAPVADRVTLVDVACPQPGACVAVGSLGTLPTSAEAVVLHQAGSGWERVPVPVALGAVRGVTCVATDDCLILGDIDFHDDGSTLAVVPPAPVGDDPFGSALDCVPGGGCLQVDGSSSSWWDGTAWAPAVPLPTGMMRTDPQLSCTSADACLLVTADFGIEGWPTPATVTSSTWDGAAWSPVVTLDHQTRALDLDCATATACFATAGVRADYWTGPLGPVPAEVLRWDGAAWTAEAITYPGGAVPTEPGTVSCSSPTDCTVLSVAGSGSPPSPTVLARWDGGGWTGSVTDAATPATALACASPTDCTSVGAGVAQRFDGVSWVDTVLPSGTSPGEVFAAVSCAGDADCVAVGSAWTLRTPAEGPLVTPTLQRFDGDAWTVEQAGDVDLRHVDCPSPSSCMATGSDLGSTWSRHWDGTAWQALATISDHRASGVTGLSCPTTTWCLATTTAFNGGPDIAWVWTGGAAWTELGLLPDRSGTTAGLSCTAPGACVAVSNWIGPQAHQLGGTTWTPLPLDGLGLGASSSFEDVACTAPGECVAVGRAGYVDDAPQGLLGVLADGTWTATIRPGVGVIDVDCWSGDGCAAVASGNDPRLEVWDGSTWRRAENPPGVNRPMGVSCGAPERCEVIGGFVDGDHRAAVAGVVLDT